MILKIQNSLHGFCQVCGEEGVGMKQINRWNSNDAIFVICSDCLDALRIAVKNEFE